MTDNRQHSTPPRQRRVIASAAAKLIAESGISDYEKAKRKAALSLGLTERGWLPENSEVDTELRSYQQLFQSEEQTERICYLRRIAVYIMTIMQEFHPYLTGSVLDGSACRHAEIDIQLFTDSAKDVEIFLLNKQIDYQHENPRTDRAEAVFAIRNGEVRANLIVYPSNFERISFKTRNGQTRPRAKVEAVIALLKANESNAVDSAQIP